jgi:Fe-S oxidoreductase
LRQDGVHFPGCGSERLYAEIAEAAIYSLLKTGVRVVLPPPHLCCGFPAKANAKSTMHGDVTLRDTIILSQIREMLGYISFDGLIVSCGTCREALHELGAEEILGCSLADVSSFVLEQAPERFTQDKERQFLYHAPCHDSLQGEGHLMVRRIGGQVTSIGGCCSEAGTMALSRPDITGAMLRRKRDNLLAAGDTSQARTIVTKLCVLYFRSGPQPRFGHPPPASGCPVGRVVGWRRVAKRTENHVAQSRGGHLLTASRRLFRWSIKGKSRSDGRSSPPGKHMTGGCGGSGTRYLDFIAAAARSTPRINR